MVSHRKELEEALAGKDNVPTRWDNTLKRNVVDCTPEEEARFKDHLAKRASLVAQLSNHFSSWMGLVGKNPIAKQRLDYDVFFDCCAI